MRKNQEISLSIPHPCTQDWDKMSATEQGRHCSNCNKTVIDFSNYTDRELAEFFKKAKGEVCGRINNYQANRPILITERANRSIFHKLLYGTALASWLGIASTANAQSNSATTQTEQKKTGEVKIAESNNTATSLFYIEGTLIDAKTHEPIPFANVVIRYDDTIINTTMSDINGHFKMNIFGEYKDKKLSLVCHDYGYEKDVQKIKPEPLETAIRLGTIALIADPNYAPIIVGRMDYGGAINYKGDRNDLKVINVDSIKERSGIK
jgi:hypothetical protein